MNFIWADWLVVGFCAFAVVAVAGIVKIWRMK